MSRRQQKIYPYLFLVPFFAMFLMFAIFPLIQGLSMSLQKISMTGATFIGLRNYVRLLGNANFYKGLQVTGLYTLIHGSIHLLLALGVALLVNSKFRGRVFYRTVFFLPVVTSLVVAGIFWKLLLDQHIGLINLILTNIGLPRYDWLHSKNLILFSVIIVGTWRWFGFLMIIFLAGLQNIPEELYDAAKIDGASRFQVIRHVTLPLLFPVIFFCIAIVMIGDLKVFDLPFILTTTSAGEPPGGPGGNAMSLSLYLYRVAFISFRLGYAAALGYFLALIIMGASILYVSILGKRAGFTR